MMYLSLDSSIYRAGSTYHPIEPAPNFPVYQVPQADEDTPLCQISRKAQVEFMAFSLRSWGSLVLSRVAGGPRSLPPTGLPIINGNGGGAGILIGKWGCVGTSSELC